MAIFALLETEAYGVYHFSNLGQCSWFEFASAIVDQAKASGCELKVRKMIAIPTEEYPLPAKRPANSVLSKEKIRAVTAMDIPAWQESLQKYLDCRS